MKLSVLAFFAMFIVATSAKAVTLTPGGPSIELKAGEAYNYQNTFKGNFKIEDRFDFTTAVGLTTVTTSIALNFNPPVQGPTGVKNLTVAWYDIADNLMGSKLFVTNGAGVVNDGSAVLLVALTSTPLYLLVTGTTLASGGFYDLHITATPLPPALILFGTALAGLTWLGRRRRPTKVVL